MRCLLGGVISDVVGDCFGFVGMIDFVCFDFVGMVDFVGIMNFVEMMGFVEIDFVYFLFVEVEVEVVEV
jgi:hypothetical protein